MERKLGKESFYYVNTSLLMCPIDPSCMPLVVRMFVFVERQTGITSFLSGKGKIILQEKQ